MRAKPPKSSEAKVSARVRLAGINPFVAITAATSRKIAAGRRRPIPVCVRFGVAPKVWRTNLMPMGDGTFRLYLHSGMRKAAGVVVGDKVTVVVSFDHGYRNGPAHPMPPAFAAKLRRNREACDAWTALRPSLQKELLRYLAGLESREALERNITRALFVLSGGTARFLGRTWNETSEKKPQAGAPTGNRTPVSALRGPRPNR